MNAKSTTVMPNNETKNWTDINHPSAYSGIDIFAKENPTIKSSAIKNEILPSIPTYQKFRGKKEPQIYNPYFVRSLRKVIQADLLHMLHPKDLVSDNSGHKYILVIQDVFSRKVWTRALKDKSAKTVNPKFKSILAEMKPFKKRARLIIDRGTEFLNKTFTAMLASENISITHPSDGHAAHVERAILSLQRLLYQHIEQTGGSNLNWTKFLPKATDIMNRRHHRIIKSSPNNAELAKNKDSINQAMALYRQKAFEKKRKNKKAKFQLGDLVRIQRWKNKFARGYDRNFSTEVFIVTKVLSHLPITMYTVKDTEKNRIQGNFYANELSSVKGNLFLVEKIIRKKKIDGEEYGLVKWEGFSSSYNTWEKMKDLDPTQDAVII